MLDIGFTKLMIVGGLALIVIGPERLPRVARTLGTLLGRAQRYVAEVKSEVSRSMDLEELQRAKRQFETAAADVRHSVAEGLDSVTQEVNDALGAMPSDSDSAAYWGDAAGLGRPAAAYQPPRKNWRLKRGAMPLWYKQKHGVRRQVQSGAARVARFRPTRT